ncbi:MAG: hypothetical protein VKJ02_07330, partial [Snowella sp.]|nr:hypothetical protein [Snowella sp.]
MSVNQPLVIHGWSIFAHPIFLNQFGLAGGRVGRERYHSLPPSEPDVQLSLHPAQAMYGKQAFFID